MEEDVLPEKYRVLINKNWNKIKNSLDKQHKCELIFKDITIYAENADIMNISLNIIDNQKTRDIIIRKKAKFIKLRLNKKQVKDELLYNPRSILSLTKFYKMEHPVFTLKKENETQNISVDENTAKIIFENKDITEIIDDKFEEYINIKDFLEYKRKSRDNVSDYYNEIYEENIYSKLINNDKYIYSEARNKLSDSFMHPTSKNIFVKIACYKIGMSFSIKRILKFMKAIYINFEDMFKIKKNSGKRKYIFQQFFNIFEDYQEYQKFINEYIFNIVGYGDALKNITDLISSLIKYKQKYNIDKYYYIYLDNYDDNLVKNDNKLSDKYIENINSIIKDKKIKIILLGKGLYIKELLYKYLYYPMEIKDYVEVEYITTLMTNLENNIHEINKTKNINEIEEYLVNKYNENYEIIYNFILFKNIMNIMNKDFIGYFPFQFLKFETIKNINKKDEIKASFQFQDLIDLNNNKIREYFLKLNNNYNNLLSKKNSNPVLDGYIMEELIVSLFINNNAFKNIKFQKENIIEVEEIIDLKKIKEKKNLKKGPILFIQKYNGQALDFAFIINNHKIDYFFGAQVGTNKRASEIEDCLNKLYECKDELINEANRITKRNIKELGFLIILNKEKQEELKKDYHDIHSKKIDLEKKNSSIYIKKEIQNLTKQLSYFNINYGIQCCENEDINYYLFSKKDLSFYSRFDEKCDSLDLDSIFLIYEGYDQFIRKEYGLVHGDDEDVLNNIEKKLLLEKLKEIDSGIISIDFNFKITKSLSLLSGTPYQGGILSITENRKLFTYFYDEKFYYLLIEKNKIKKINKIEDVPNFCFNSDIIIDKYFGTIVFQKIEEEKKNKIKEKKRKKEVIYKNKLKYLQKKRNIK